MSHGHLGTGNGCSYEPGICQDQLQQPFPPIFNKKQEKESPQSA